MLATFGDIAQLSLRLRRKTLQIQLQQWQIGIQHLFLTALPTANHLMHDPQGMLSFQLSIIVHHSSATSSGSALLMLLASLKHPSVTAVGMLHTLIE